MVCTAEQEGGRGFVVKSLYCVPTIQENEQPVSPPVCWWVKADGISEEGEIFPGKNICHFLSHTVNCGQTVRSPPVPKVRAASTQPSSHLLLIGVEREGKSTKAAIFTAGIRVPPDIQHQTKPRSCSKSLQFKKKKSDVDDEDSKNNILE